MFQWFRKEQKADGLCSLCASPKGLAFVHLIPSQHHFKFKLNAATFIQNTELNEAPKQLKGFVESWKVRGASCAVVLPSSEYRLLLLETPNVPQGEIERAVRWLIKDLIDYPLKEVAIEVFPAPTRLGQAPKLYVAVTRLKLIQDISSVIENMGLHLSCVDITDLAICRLLSAISNKQEGVAFLVLDADKPRIIVMRNNVLYLERNLNANPITVEEIKKQEHLSDLILEIQRSLDFYQSQFGQAAPTRLLLGAEFSLRGFKEELAEGLTVKVEVLQLQKIIEINQGVSLDIAGDYMAPIGTGIKELEK